MNGGRDARRFPDRGATAALRPLRRGAGPAQLESYFHLDDKDRGLIARCRNDHTRLGFAVQLGTVRFLGTFLADPSEVPRGVVAYLARQLGIADSSGLKRYAAGVIAGTTLPRFVAATATATFTRVRGRGPVPLVRGNRPDRQGETHQRRLAMRQVQRPAQPRP